MNHISHWLSYYDHWFIQKDFSKLRLKYKDFSKLILKYIDKYFETRKENRNLNFNVFLIDLFNFVNDIAMFSFLFTF